MNFTQSFRLAIKSLTTSKMRALLTMLGIIIGVGAVIVILSLGNGLTGMIQQQVDKMGINMIQVQIWSVGDGMMPDPEELYDLVDENPHVLSGVSPYINLGGVVRHGDEKFDRTSVYGVSEIMYNAATNYTMDGEQLAKGRFISYMDVERREAVCVIGAYLEQEAFGGDALGKHLSINGRTLTVVGVLKRNAEFEMLPGSQDDQIYMPYSTVMEIIGDRWVGLYIFTSTSGETANAAKGVIEAYLNDFFRTDDGMYNYFYIMTMAEQANQINAMMGVAMGVLVAIAAISLLVGGIGIMNIMLVSVTERTREIGVRKSLGAKRKDIRSQFVIEAGTTSAIGGLLGIGFGCLLAKLLEALLAVEEPGNYIGVDIASGVLTNLIQYTDDYCGIIDWEKGICNFEGELFSKMMQVAGRYGYTMDKIMEEADDAYNKPYVGGRMSIMDIYEYETLAEMEAQGKIPLLSAEGNPYGYSFGGDIFAINANSEHIEGAWEFLAYLMSDEVQRTQTIPMGATSRVVCMEEVEKELRWLEEGNVEQIKKGHFNSKGEIIYTEVRTVTREDITDEKVAEYISMKDRAVPGNGEEARRMKPIWQIIWEESEAYFVGDKSIEEVADIINNRVQLYLDENR